MKIYRIAAIKPMYFGDPNSTPDHDYDPSWDYESDQRPKRKLKRQFEQAALSISQNHMDKFKGVFTRFRLFFSSNAGGALARYVVGTYSEPVIVVDLTYCKQAMMECQRELGARYCSEWDVAYRTLMHELWHAFQEGEGLEFDEDEAESFATDN